MYARKLARLTLVAPSDIASPGRDQQSRKYLPLAIPTSLNIISLTSYNLNIISLTFHPTKRLVRERAPITQNASTSQSQQVSSLFTKRPFADVLLISIESLYLSAYYILSIIHVPPGA